MRAMDAAPKLIAVVPTLNAAAVLPSMLSSLNGIEVVIADGGSTDETVSLGRAGEASVVEAPPGRGAQLAAGAEAALTRGAAWLLFLHADTVLPAGWGDEVRRFMVDDGNRDKAAYFRFGLDDGSASARRLEAMVAWRSRVLALPYGDQGLLISRELYERIGGFRPLPIMEDVDIVRRLGRRRLQAMAGRALTSAAKFRRRGYLLRSTRNLFCLALFFLGVPTPLIARIYG